MKKTQFIDLIATIRKTAVSFMAIAVFIALGLAFYGGLVWAVDHMESSFACTYRDGSMQTLLVTDPLGLSPSQVEELKTIEGIDDAEGSNIVYRFFKDKSGNRQQAAVIQMTGNLNRLMQVEGQLPTAAGETAVLRSWAEENGVSIGDRIALEEKDGADFRSLQSVRAVAEWSGESLDDLRTGTEDPGYLVESELTVTAIVDSPVYLAVNPYAHGICSANGLYIDAVFYVSEEEMPREHFGGYTSVVLYSDELNRMNCFQEEYKSRSKALSEKVQEKVDEWDKELTAEFKRSVGRLRQQLDAFTRQTGGTFPEGENLYASFLQMQEELDEQESFTDVAETNANNSYLVADNLISILNGMRSVLGIAFLVIGVLICYSTVSRLIADGRVETGTRRALGFYRKEILRFYLSYVSASAFLGGILGVVIGIFGIEYAFNRVFAAQFTFTEVPLVCDLADVLPVFLTFGVILLAVTVAACIGEMGKSVISLLQKEIGKTENPGFVRKSRFFQKLSLLNQTVWLNLSRDRRRVFGMIMGIAGAAALITAGLTLYVNFTDAFSRQFEDYYRFNYEIRYDAASDTASEEIRRVLDRYGLEYAELYSSCLIMYTPDSKTNAPTVIVPADRAELAKIMRFDTETKEDTAYDSGLWMSEYYRYAFEAPVGSFLELKTLSGKKEKIPVDNYYKHHLSTPVIVMDPDTYQNAFGETAAPNAFYVASESLDRTQLSKELESIEGYIYTEDFYASCMDSFLSEKAVIAAFAVLFITMAVLMALMILINQLNVYISEKKEELIILMICGYDLKFVKSYIYQDTVLLTLIGILTGLIAGSILGDRTLISIEGTSARMIHEISWISCGAAAAVTAMLTALICRQALRQVDGFRLSDLNNG